MKKILLSLICIFLVLSTLGCTNMGDTPPESPPQTTDANEKTHIESPPEPDISSWDDLIVIPEHLGMESTLDNPLFSEVFNNTSKAPLNKLIAFCLIADGLSEGASDELYRRFIEAPNTVLVFLSLLENQTYPLTGIGEVSIAEFACQRIAFADVVWYGSTDAFDNVIKEYRNYYPTGRINELLDILEREHHSAIELNPPNG